MVLVDSYGQVALAVNTGSAEEVLSLAAGDRVELAGPTPLRRDPCGRGSSVARRLGVPRLRRLRDRLSYPLACSAPASCRVKTFVAKPATIEKKWYVVDASGQTLGSLSTVVADTLRGKRKPIYTPNIDTGDFVVIVNAEKIVVTGKKARTRRCTGAIPATRAASRASRSGTSWRAAPKRSCAAPSRACCRTTGSGRRSYASSRSTPAQSTRTRHSTLRCSTIKE